MIRAGGGVFGLGFGGFHVGLRDDTGFSQPADTLEVQAIEFGGGLGGAKLGLLDRFVDLHKGVAGLHLGPGLEENANNFARNLGGHHDTAGRFHRADGLERGCERLGGRLLNDHGLGGHLKSFAHFDEVYDLERFDADDGTDEHKEGENGEENLFFHRKPDAVRPTNKATGMMWKS